MALLGCCLLGSSMLEAEGSDSPILRLEDVLGFDVERSSLAERTVKGSGETKLVQVAEKGQRSPLVRRWDPAYARFGYVRVVASAGGFLAGHTVTPRSPESPPAVILLDEELRYFASPGTLREDQDPDEAEGIALGRLPLGSHLIANGFAVLFPAKNVFEKADPFEVGDWYGLIEKWVKRAGVDRESVFLVATHENAQLALTLSSQIRFAGVVIESPRRLMFRGSKKEGKQGEAKSSSDGAEGEVLDLGVFESEAQMSSYIRTMKSQRVPVQLVASKVQIKDELLKKSLLFAVSLTGGDLRVTVLDDLARRPRGEREEAAIDFAEGQDEHQEPVASLGNRRGDPSRASALAFGYDLDAFEKWVTRMVPFMITGSRNQPYQIPEPQRGERREGGRGASPFSEPRDFGGGADAGGRDGGGGE